MKKPNKICAVTRERLLKAKVRDWQKATTYEAIYLVPTRKKHDSGWMVMAIVGRNGNKYEVAAHCDDICWNFATDKKEHSMHTDCTFPGGIVHMWDAKFTVGTALSTTKVTVERGT